MRTPEDVRSVLRTRYRRSVVQWLALLPTCGADRVLVSLPLDPPTARIARDANSLDETFEGKRGSLDWRRGRKVRRRQGQARPQNLLRTWPFWA